MIMDLELGRTVEKKNYCEEEQFSALEEIKTADVDGITYPVTMVTEELIKACDFCGVKSGRDTDKFLETGLSALPAARLSSAPLIAQSPVNIECRVVQKLTPGSHHIFLARVEAVDIDEDRLDENGKFELNRAGLAAYSHGEYFALGRKLGSFGFSVRRKEKR
jgi:flavin reductase (DIM6/NTAB) family NADH-FMN oxidoreductase RutF